MDEETPEAKLEAAVLAYMDAAYPALEALVLPGFNFALAMYNDDTSFVIGNQHDLMGASAAIQNEIKNRLLNPTKEVPI